MTDLTLPDRKPNWLLHQLSLLEQRQAMIRDVIAALLTAKANQGLDTQPALLRALSHAQDDLTEVQQQLALFEAGWTALHPKPEQS